MLTGQKSGLRCHQSQQILGFDELAEDDIGGLELVFIAGPDIEEAHEDGHAEVRARDGVIFGFKTSVDLCSRCQLCGGFDLLYQIDSKVSDHSFRKEITPADKASKLAVSVEKHESENPQPDNVLSFATREWETSGFGPDVVLEFQLGGEHIVRNLNYAGPCHDIGQRGGLLCTALADIISHVLIGLGKDGELIVDVVKVAISRSEFNPK